MEMANTEIQQFPVQLRKAQEIKYKKLRELKRLSKQEFKLEHFNRILKNIAYVDMDSLIKILQWFNVNKNVKNGTIFNVLELRSIKQKAITNISALVAAHFII